MVLESTWICFRTLSSSGCACNVVPTRENIEQDLEITIVMNSTDPLVHHILYRLDSLTLKIISYKCEACNLQSSEECPALGLQESRCFYSSFRGSYELQSQRPGQLLPCRQITIIVGRCESMNL